MDEERRTDIEDTVELPVIDAEYETETKDPMRIIFPVVGRIGIVFALILTVTLTGRAIYIWKNGEKIELVDDRRLVFSGHNGAGYTDVMFHPESLALKKLRKERDLRNKQKKNTDNLSTLIDSIDCSFDQSDHLSNGMSVTYACSYNAKAAKEAGYSVTDTSRTYTVMGLSDYVDYHPFDHIEAAWDPSSGTMNITPDASNNRLGILYDYEYDGSQKVTIHAYADSELLHQSGVDIPYEETEKTITVEPAWNREEQTEEELPDWWYSYEK